MSTSTIENAIIDYFKGENKTYKTAKEVYDLIQLAKGLTGIFVANYKFVLNGETVEGHEHEHTDHVIILHGSNVIRVFCINGYVDICDFKNIAINGLELLSFNNSGAIFPNLDNTQINPIKPTAKIKIIPPSQCELLLIECECGYHMGIDFSYVDQVSDFKTPCPSCDLVIDTATIK